MYTFLSDYTIEEYEEDLGNVCERCGNAYAEPDSSLCSVCIKESKKEQDDQVA